MARTSPRRVAVSVAAALTLACLAGCAGTASSAISSPTTAPSAATVSTSADAASTSAAAVSTGSVSTPAGPGPFASDATDRKLAASLAATNLRALTLPAGSRKLSGPPPGTWRDVVEAGTVIGEGGQVVDTSWWQVPGQPQAVLKELQKHTPKGWSEPGQGSYGPVAEPGGTTPTTQPPADVYRAWNDSFQNSHAPAVIGFQQLLVTEIENGAGQVYTQVDSLVSWIAPRPANDRVPASAKVVTVTAMPMAGTAMPQGSPATITDPAAVSRIASLLNGLYRTIWTTCAPPPPMNEIRLEFRATAGGPVLATAIVELKGCDMVQLTFPGAVPGSATQPLAEGNSSFGPDIVSLAGLNWFR